jgi:Fe-S cluster assembly protein SufD
VKQLEPLFSLPADLTASWRQKSWQRCQTLGVPPLKSEGFQYVPLAKWRSKSYLLPQPSDLTPDPFAECAFSYAVFVDGFFQPHLSQIPSPLVALPLPAAMKSYGLFLQNRLQRSLKEETDFFALFNGACHGRGLFLYAPPHATFSSPLQIIHLSRPNSLSLPRIQLVMGKQANLQIIHTSPIHDSHAFIDCVLDEASRCSFYDLSLPTSSSWQTQAFRALLKRDSFLQTFHLTTGAETVRTSLKIELAEENSEALAQGLSLLSHQTESHFHGRVEHQAPHCRSRQHIKAVLQDQSRSSFEGKIYVHPIAQKTEAYQNSQTLLLSNEAVSYSKPNLEIFADDVKASHGATISQPDAEALFYLRSRGLSSDQSRSLLVQGFCQELLQSIPFSSIHEKILRTGALSFV